MDNFANLPSESKSHVTVKKDSRLQVRMQGSYEAVEMSDQAGPETIEVTVYLFDIRDFQNQ